MNVSQMREYISNAYSGDKWKAKCKCMHDRQVIAIYYSIQAAARDRKDNKKETRQVKQDKAGIQLTIFDLL